MPIWNGIEFKTIEQGKEWWSNTDNQDMNKIMGLSRKSRITWLGVATEIVTPGSSVFDPGCGTGLMIEALPENVDYYGIDLNSGYVEQAQKSYTDRPNTTFEVRDLYEVLDSDMMFDYTVITSLFGVFPEDETYKLISKFWEKSRLGMSITTLNKDKYHPRNSNRLTSHDPRELEYFLRDLPGVSTSKVQTVFDPERHKIRRALAAYAWRDNV